jgi:hypothetical protein
LDISTGVSDYCLTLDISTGVSDYCLNLQKRNLSAI